MRNLIVLLSLAAVIACPYECAAKFAAARVIGDEAKPACCDACEAPRPTALSEEAVPSAPMPEKEGRCCLCEGAVFDAGTRLAIDDSVLVALWTGDAGLADCPTVSASSLGFEHSASPPSKDGRHLRIALRSLLL